MKALVAALAALAALIVPSAEAHAADGEAAAEGRLRQLVAELRVSHGLAAFEQHPELDTKADAWARTMADEGRIWHSTLSDGITANWRRLGENVGMGGGIEQIHDALVRSPQHYANLTNPEFGHAGFGVATSPRGLFVAQVFMTLAPAGRPAARPAPAPSAPAAPVPAPVAPVPSAEVVPAAPRPVAARPVPAPRPASGARTQALPAPAVGPAALPLVPEPTSAPPGNPAAGADVEFEAASFSTRLASFANDPLPGAGSTLVGWAVAALTLASAGRLAATARRRLSRWSQPHDPAGAEQHQPIR